MINLLLNPITIFILQVLFSWLFLSLCIAAGKENRK